MTFIRFYLYYRTFFALENNSFKETSFLKQIIKIRANCFQVSLYLSKPFEEETFFQNSLFV